MTIHRVVWIVYLMKPTPNFVKLVRKGGLFTESVHLVDVGSKCVGFPKRGIVYTRPHGPEDPPPREYDGHTFVHFDQVVFVAAEPGVDTWGDRPRLGVRRGWVQVKPTGDDFEDATAVVVDSRVDGIDDGDAVLLGGASVGVEGPDGTRIVHEDSVYGVRKS